MASGYKKGKTPKVVQSEESKLVKRINEKIKGYEKEGRTMFPEYKNLIRRITEWGFETSKTKSGFTSIRNTKRNLIGVDEKAQEELTKRLTRLSKVKSEKASFKRYEKGLKSLGVKDTTEDEVTNYAKMTSDVHDKIVNDGTYDGMYKSQEIREIVKGKPEGTNKGRFTYDEMEKILDWENHVTAEDKANESAYENALNKKKVYKE